MATKTYGDAPRSPYLDMVKQEVARLDAEDPDVKKRKSAYSQKAEQESNRRRMLGGEYEETYPGLTNADAKQQEIESAQNVTGGYIDAAKTVASSLASLVPAGISGIATAVTGEENRPKGIRGPDGWQPSLMGEDPITPGEAVERTMQKFTRAPKSEAGQRVLGSLGDAMNAIGEELLPVREAYEENANALLGPQLAGGLYAGAGAVAAVAPLSILRAAGAPARFAGKKAAEYSMRNTLSSGPPPSGGVPRLTVDVASPQYKPMTGQYVKMTEDAAQSYVSPRVKEMYPESMTPDPVFEAKMQQQGQAIAATMANKPAPVTEPVTNNALANNVGASQRGGPKVPEKGGKLVPVKSRMDAERHWEDPNVTVYAVNEMDEIPSEVTSLDMLNAYAPDQLYVAPKGGLLGGDVSNPVKKTIFVNVEPLTKNHIEQLGGRGGRSGKTIVMVNPDEKDLARFSGRDGREVRFSVDKETGDLYVWPAEVLHSQVEPKLGIAKSRIETWSDAPVEATELGDWFEHWADDGRFVGDDAMTTPMVLKDRVEAGTPTPDGLLGGSANPFKNSVIEEPVFHGTAFEKPIDKFSELPAYFTNDRGWSKSFGKNVNEVYLDIKNPEIIDGTESGRHFEWDAEDVAEYRAEGKDGVIIRHPDGDVYAVFDAEQIKPTSGGLLGEGTVTNQFNVRNSLEERLGLEDAPEPKGTWDKEVVLSDDPMRARRLRAQYAKEGAPAEVLKTLDDHIKSLGPEDPPLTKLSPMADAETARNVLEKDIWSKDAAKSEERTRNAIYEYADWDAKQKGFRDRQHKTEIDTIADNATSELYADPERLKAALDGDMDAIRGTDYGSHVIVDGKVVWQPAEGVLDPWTRITPEELAAAKEKGGLRAYYQLKEKNKGTHIDDGVIWALIQKKAEVDPDFKILRATLDETGKRNKYEAKLEAMSREELKAEIDRVFDTGSAAERAARRGWKDPKQRGSIDNTKTKGLNKTAAKTVGRNALNSSSIRKSDTNSLNRSNYIYGGQPAEKQNSRRIVDAGLELQDQALEVWGGKPMELTEANAKVVSDNMTAEALASFKKRPEMSGWYKANLEEAMSHASKIHPELKTDPQAQSAFKFIMAITSNGQEVGLNAKLTNKYYKTFRKTGRFLVVGSGKERVAMEKSFETANRLIDDLGYDGFDKFLDQDFTVKELLDAGFKISGENVDTVVKGSVIFGPKVGGGFMQNLRGNYDPPTFDRWWQRTYGRHTGTLISDPMKIGDQMEAFADALNEVEPGAFRTIGMTRKQAIENPDEAARLIYSNFSKQGFKVKSEVNNAARNLVKSLDNVVDAPAGGNQREYMRKVIVQVRDNLRQQGIDVDTADVQALLWYAEKDLYGKMGANVNTETVDYATVWKQLAEQGQNKNALNTGAQ